jgi:hypothetical protein
MFDHDDCRTYVDHVRILFRHLLQMVDQLKFKANEATGSVTACEDARHLIADIADKFSAYVAEEKGGGCIDEAVCRCPRLAPHEREINQQYPEIQSQIAWISRMLEGCDVLGTSARAVCKEADTLAAALGKLEADERYLLREAFGTDESFASKRE